MSPTTTATWEAQDAYRRGHEAGRREATERLAALEEHIRVLEALQAGRAEEDARTRAGLADVGRVLDGWQRWALPTDTGVRMAVVLGPDVDAGDATRLQARVDAILRGTP
jgi:hypothetical protein